MALEINVVKERENPLLERKEYVVEILHPSASSPKREDSINELLKKFSVSRERLVIEWMRPAYGAPKSRGFVLVYANEKALRKTTRHHILLRNGLIAKEAGKEPAKEVTPETTKTAVKEEQKETKSKKE